MSHTLKITTQFRDASALALACQALHLNAPALGAHKLYETEHRGLGIKLPGWKFPVVVDTSTGEVHYDDYHGNWGDIKHLHRLKQEYAVAKTTIAAKAAGRLVRREEGKNGAIKLHVTGY